ncbi:ABC transporter substrate-binding protein [Pseudonocardia acaciae]|uniref:ABC transporter substrate-binding protein n=1 Tax=Pseudonocardia acaciae TaxID=551276 RepID=UPI00048C285D|nr:extracellular solute-binding protein [Pseudonocardia acaciae]
MEWTRRRFLGTGASALGVLGLSACGGSGSSTPRVQVEVPPDVVSAAGPYKGSSLGMLSQKLYSDRANAALDRSLQAFAKATGTTVENSLVSSDTGDLVAKTDAAVKAGNPRDIAFFNDNRFVAQFHNLGDLVDVTDVVTELSARYGEPAAESRNFCSFGGRWFAIPYQFVGSGAFARKDWLQEKGIALKESYTWAEMRDICLEISDPSKRRFGWGLTVNRSGDGNGFLEYLIYGYGGSITANDGRKVTFNSPETIDAVEFVRDLYTNPKYKPMLPPGIESWTDSSNNENWLAGILGFTRNQYSLYADSKATKNPVYANTHPFIDCTGPASRRPLAWCQSQAFVIFKGAKNPELAKVMAQYLVSGTPLLGVSKDATGLAMPAWEKVWASDEFYLRGDPAFPMLHKLATQPLPITTTTGNAFPQAPSPGEQATLQAYVLTDMMQEVLRGTPGKDAVATAHQRIVRIFEQQGIAQ